MPGAANSQLIGRSTASFSASSSWQSLVFHALSNTAFVAASARPLCACEPRASSVNLRMPERRMASTRSAAQSAGCLVTRSHSSSHSWCLLLPSSDLNVSSFTSSASFFAASPHLPCAAMPLLAAITRLLAGLAHAPKSAQWGRRMY